MDCERRKELLILSPSEIPDTQLISEAIRAGAEGILHIGGDNKVAEELITAFSRKTQSAFGICITLSTVLDFAMPTNLTKVIVPFGYNEDINGQIEILYQVHSVEEAQKAIAQKVSSIVIKGSEGAGKTASISSFDIFRKIIKQSQENSVKVYVQGGAGIHTSAAFLALGAHGIIFDSQIALFPECSLSGDMKNILNQPDENKTKLSSIGHDVCLAADFAKQYKNIRKFVAAFYETAYGHLHQAKNQKIIDYESNTAAVSAESKKMESSFSNLLLWEKQIARMLQKEKNFSKFSIELPTDVPDAFFGAFASVMAASAAIKGIKVRIIATSGEEISPVLQQDVQELLSELDDIPPMVPISNPLNIAVVGMECIYPGAANIDEYWKNILSGKNCVTEVPTSHWDKEFFYKPDSKDTDYSASKWGGFIPEMDFDPVEYGIVPHSLFMTEPSQLISLLLVKRALHSAGYENLSEYNFEDTSVFIGANSLSERITANLNAKYKLKQLLGSLPDHLQESFMQPNEFTFPGILPNIITGRVANRLNFGGRNYTVDAACASSLAALDIACHDLRSHRSQMAIVGGVDLHNSVYDFLMFSSTHVLSPKGCSAPFDADADGIVLGEGGGILVLKRLEDAERNGDKIYAVIKGISGSSDGRNFSVTAPSRSGESKALERTYQDAGILPSEAGMIEAHGTGTVVGDRVELTSLTDLFHDSGAIPGQTYIGSVKSQIGHTKCAAGVAGLIKAILSVYHGITPPTINLNNVNNFYDPNTSPFVFNKQAGLWKDEKRIAGISAFGFGGSNFHVVIENYPNDNYPVSVCKSWNSELFVFRGDSLDEAQMLMRKIKDLLMPNHLIKLIDIAYSLAAYNDKKIQVSIVAGSVEELLTKIDAVLCNRREFQIYQRNEVEGKVAFLFSGQGSQYVNMARDLFVAFPSMRRLLDKNSEYIRILFPEAAFDEATQKAQEKMLTDTRNAQPLLGVVDLAIAEHLRFLGIEPDMIAGHSYGELPALCFAGAINPDDLIRLSTERAKAILDVVGKNKGKLVAAILTEEELSPLLADETEVWAVNFNSPKQIVLGGTVKGIESFMKKAAAKNIFCSEINVECAFHSPLLNGAEKLYEKVLKEFVFKTPTIPVWENMFAGIYPSEAGEIKKHLAKQLIEPILFTKQIENMYEAGARIFIETGPGSVLLGLAEATLGKKAVTIRTENKSSEGVSCLLKALGQYLASGKMFHIERLFEGRSAKLIQIDKPELYKKSATGWLFNGNKAYPSCENKLSSKYSLIL